MKLSDNLKMELIGIQKYFHAVHSDIYSRPAASYQFIVSNHSNDIEVHKDRLEEMMDLTDKKES